MKNGNYILGAGIASILFGALLFDNTDASITPLFIILIGIGCVIGGIVINIKNSDWS